MNERQKRSLQGEEDEDKNERRESKKKERMKEGEIDKMKEKPVTGSDRKRREQATKSEKGRWGWENKAIIFRCLHHRCKCCAPLPKISCHPLTLGDIKSTSLSL